MPYNPSQIDDPKAKYVVTLKETARHGTTLLRPRDRHVVRGSAIPQIEPQEAIKAIEKI